ncbi:hypothetical protein EG68_01675, partial [Paragonimus skrjabini miyazakii]
DLYFTHRFTQNLRRIAKSAKYRKVCLRKSTEIFHGDIDSTAIPSNFPTLNKPSCRLTGL